MMFKKVTLINSVKKNKFKQNRIFRVREIHKIKCEEPMNKLQVRWKKE